MFAEFDRSSVTVSCCGLDGGSGGMGTSTVVVFSVGILE